MTGRIFDIQKFSIHDGPGIRTTVFFKGCSLNCAWCHNPESISKNKQIQTYFSKCIGCGKCFEVCKEGAHIIFNGSRLYQRQLCKSCGECVSECYSGALVMTGFDITVDDLMTKIEADAPFYSDSDGGVTFSGGEPLLQPDFLVDVLKCCKDIGIHTAVDTAGNVPFKNIEMVMPYTDLFLYDLKAMNDEVHKEFTGVSNKLLLSNLKELDSYGANIRIRVPVITGANDTDSEFIAMAVFLSKLKNIEGVEPLAYHSLGVGKLESMGKKDNNIIFETPTTDRMEYIRLIFSEAGLNVIKR